MAERIQRSVSLSDIFRPNHAHGLRSRDLSTTRLQLLKREIQTDLHIIPLQELLLNLGTDPELGLSSARAAELLQYYGPNALTPTSGNGWLHSLFKSMCTGFSLLVWFGAALCILAYVIELTSQAAPSRDNLYLGLVLMLVDVVCGLFSFCQNYRSVKIMSTFKSMIPSNATAVRDGGARALPTRDLVRGDVVLVSAGDVVPADIRIIDSKGFKVDNSSLTGESVAVSRGNSDGTANILESPNVAFFSTQCVEGHAKGEDRVLGGLCSGPEHHGVVISCGDLTALGRVAGLAARLQPKPSPLSRQISRFMAYMSAWAVALGAVIAAAALALGYPVIQTIVFVIGIVVANIPEGLQPTVTSALTITAQTMARKNCLVKNLEAVEALGACSTVCSDKTGTLTENRMRVRSVWLLAKHYCVDDEDFRKQVRGNEAYEALQLCGALCSTAAVRGGAVSGDASETAILSFVLSERDALALRERHPKLAEIPFNSTDKYQASVHLEPTAGGNVAMLKGAPETVAARCATVALRRGDARLTPKMLDGIERAVEKLANTGERVLAFADLHLDPARFPPGFAFDGEEVNFPLDGLRFLGLIGLKDPPRQQVRAAIERVRAAGVRVLMVTGDHPATAKAIALEVGIATDDSAHVVTGAALRAMTGDLLDKTLLKHYEIVFARTSPTQKLQIVEACQRAGAVVAVTGDGVNDAPALRRADIGISMGITGSEVSKQTADIILMDDNFATIVLGIEEGRRIFDNLKKSICYILISNVPEVFPVLFFILFSIPLPLGVMTILCVDLGTDMWPAVALSYEPAEADVMRRPPRASHLVTGRMLQLAYGHFGLVEVAAGMFAYFVVMAEHGFYPASLFGIRKNWDNAAIANLQDSLGQEWTYGERKTLERAAQTAYFVAVVCTQVVNGVICKTRFNSIFHVGMKNHILSCGLVFELCLAVFLCYTPGVNDFFCTHPIRWEWWLLSLPFGLLMFAFDEFRKYCIREKLFNDWYTRTTYT